MSSLFTVAEVELARLGLAAVTARVGERLDVLVGGLGLGYTAITALEDDRVGTLTVVEALAPVISWHERQLLPDTSGLTTDPRTALVQGDFFALSETGSGYGASVPHPLHAVLLDIDHTPDHVLHPTSRRLLPCRRATTTRVAAASRGCLRPLVGRPARRGLPGRAASGVRDGGGARGELREPADGRHVRQHGVRRRDGVASRPGSWECGRGVGGGGHTAYAW